MDIPYYRERGQWLAAHINAGNEPPAAPDPETVVGFAHEVTRLHNARRILEIGCGWGRYSHELTKHGYRIIAADVSSDLIELGQQMAMQKRRPIAFLNEALHVLDFPPYFDTVLCFESTLPFNAPNEPAARAALTDVAELLRPGGEFFFGSAGWEKHPVPAETVYETPDGRATETVVYDDNERVLTRTFQTSGISRDRTTSYRHFSGGEMGHLLAEAGFSVRERWHTYAEGDVWEDTDRAGMIWLTQKVR